MKSTRFEVTGSEIGKGSTTSAQFAQKKEAGMLLGKPKGLKILGLAALTGLLLGAFTEQKVHAVSANAYITVRCTTTISVEVFSNTNLYPATTYYSFGDVSAAETYVSTQPIGVRNSSKGAICNWELFVPEDPARPGQKYVEGTDWKLDSTSGIDQIAMSVKFSTRTLASTDFVAADELGAGISKLYTPANFGDFCSNYIVPSYSSDISKILPYSYDQGLGQNINGKSERHLWIMMKTPTAVSNPDTDVSIQLYVIVQGTGI